jgi:prostaglandin-H2 D-isomerase / glutathione transferase
MPHYKLYYFNGRGRAELSRLIFAAAGQEFEDVRFTDDWPKHKGDFHFGQVPALEVDGEKVGQSAAIAHYLATQLGLAGKTPLDAFKTHALVETVRDLAEPVSRIMFAEKDEARKAKMHEEFETVTLKNHLEKLESYLAKHSNGTPYFVGGQLTYADLAFYNTIFGINEYLKRDVLVGHAHLQKNWQAVTTHEKVAAYLAKRAQSPW